MSTAPKKLAKYLFYLASGSVLGAFFMWGKAGDQQGGLSSFTMTTDIAEADIPACTGDVSSSGDGCSGDGCSGDGCGGSCSG
jgi:hypothetical protein